MAGKRIRLSSTIALGIAFCLAQPGWPTGEGHALAAGLTAEDMGRARQARQLYKEGDYEAAAKIYSDLSSARPDMLVFTRNLGACYYYLRRPEPALSNLREYLQRARELTPDDRGEVERWIAEMEQLRDQTAAPARVPPAVEVPPAPVLQPSSPARATLGTAPAASPVAVATPTAPLVEVVPPEPAAAPATSGSGLRIAGIACGAVGLAAIGTAIYFYTRATSLSDTVSSSDAPRASDFKSGKNAETMQWVFYGVGGAALATGAGLYYLGWRHGSDGQRSVAVAPMVGPGLAGLSAQGAF
jgi:hypothetical protein